MALIKDIVLENGVKTDYHRIVSVNNITNKSSLIEVASYTSKEKREEEKLKLKNKETMDIFINTKYITTNYTEDLNVNSAYEYLKTLSEFENSINDW